MYATVCAAVCAATRLGAQAPAPARTTDTLPTTVSTTVMSVDYGYVSFHDTLDPWHLASVSVGRRTRAGSVAGRINYANRFGASGTQVEAEAYPSLTRRTYAYLDAGYAHASIFPSWRFGAELFGNLPHAWEASLGVRQLRFAGPPVTLVTGAMGKYLGNAWVSVRPTVRRSLDGYAASTSITGRKYFADADTYVGARASVGSTPNDRLTPSELVVRQRSWSGGVQASRALRPGVVTTGGLGAEWEELAAGRVRRRWDATVGARFALAGRAR